MSEENVDVTIEETKRPETEMDNGNGETITDDIVLPEPSEKPTEHAEAATENPESVEKASTEQPGPAAAEQTKGEQSPLEKTATPPAKKKNKRSASKRIGELTFQRKEAERKLGAAEKRIQELEDKLSKSKGPESGEQPPDEDEFETFEEYTAANTEFQVKKALQEQTNQGLTEQKEALQQEKEAAQEEVKQVDQELNKEDEAAFESKFLEGEERFDKFRETVTSDKVHVTEDMLNIVKKTDDPAGILYALGTNPEVAHEIAQISDPVQQALALGRLAIPDSNMPKATKTKQTTGAPAPITPVGGTTPSVGKNPDDMSHEEYRAWREGGGG